MRAKRSDGDKGTDKRKYPIGPEHYLLYEEVGQGVSASVHRALCVPLDEIVAIKILDFERTNCNLNNVYREAQTMVLIDHPNVLRSHCSFVDDHNLWVVMPFMAGGSCLHILKAAYPDGFGEVVIATILKEVLKGLEYLHRHGHIHRDVKAGNILIDSRGTIKLGDFGVSACLFDSGDRQRTRNTFVGTPCWMAPEVLEQLHGYDFKADIWSFGITALELAHGHAPFSKYPPMKVLLMTLQSAPPGLDYERDRKFSKCFKQMIASCLVKDPSKRPSSKKLLRHSFFKQARSTDYINRKLLDDLPALGERIQALKRKEEDMLAQKKMPDGEKEELSQNEYKRGISGWNFNLDDMKAQASLIQDVEEPISDNNNGSSSLSAADENDKHQFQFSFSSSYPEFSDMEDNDVLQNQSSALPFVDSTRNTTIQKNGRVEDDSSIASSTHEVYDDQHTENVCSERPGLDIKAKSSYGNQRAFSNGSSYLPDGPPPVYKVDSEKIHPDVSSNGNLVSVPSTEDIHFDLPPKAKASVTNGDDVDDKAKVHVVQQKGRFKVTSGNVDIEKVPPTPKLQKSHSMLVITQHTSRPTSPMPSPFGPVCGSSIFETLQSALQANIQERECILTAMKQVTSAEFTAHRASDVGSVQANHNFMPERSSLESSHDREKELLDELTDLQWRLISAHDEIKKLKAENNSQNEDRQQVHKLLQKCSLD